jgi:homocysteine S-methyltransferase
MGTVLYARGVPLDACFDVLNLHDAKTVQGIHREYVAAGADLLETNTFGANRFKLALHGLEGRVREINRAGARLARDVRETMGRDVLVLGSIGPLGKYLLPLGTVGEAEATAAFLEQAEALLEGGVDGFVAETFSDLRELRLAVGAIRAVSADLPSWPRCPCRSSGRTAAWARARSTTWGSCSTRRRPGPGCRSGPMRASRAGTASG